MNHYFNFLRFKIDSLSNLKRSLPSLLPNFIIVYFFLRILELWIGYIFLPFGEDQKIFFASAKIAPYSNIYSILSASLNSWELKPFLNRFAYLALFKSSGKLADPSIISSFEIAARVLSSLFIFGVCFFFSFSKWFSAFSKQAKLALFSFLCIIFLTSTYEAAFQAEEIANLVLLFSAALASLLSPLALILSGLISSSLFYIKGIELLSIAFIPALIFLTFRSSFPWKDSLRFGVGVLIGLILLTGLLYLRSPINLVDLMEVAQNRISGQSAGLYLFSKIAFNKAILDVPVLICILIAVPLALSRLIGSTQKVLHVSIFILFFCAAMVTVYSKRGFFSYHFSSFVPFIIVTSLISAFDFGPQNSPKNRFFPPLSAFGFLAFGGIIFHFFFSQANRNIADGKVIFFGLISLILVNIFSKKFPTTFKSAFVFLVLVIEMLHFRGNSEGRVAAYKGLAHQDEKRHQRLGDELKIPESEQILYLTDGIPTYYLPYKSACRHFFPVVKSWDSGSQSAQEFRSCLERFAGNYIFHNPEWYRLDELVTTMLKKNFSLIYEEKRTSRPLLVYRRNSL